LTAVAEETRWFAAWDKIAQDPDPDPIEVVRTAGMYQRYFAAVQDRAARLARKRGVTWEEIGQAAGTTRQAAWQRFSKPTSRTSLRAYGSWPEPGRGPER
jgi:hypothetical protein